MTRLPSSTSILIVEDNSGLALSLTMLLMTSLNTTVRRLRANGQVQIVDSFSSMFKALHEQGAASINLLLLDWSIHNRPIDQARLLFQHASLAPDAFIIGYSGHIEAADAFQAWGIDGFILKGRDIRSLEHDIERIILNRDAGRDWLALL